MDPLRLAEFLLKDIRERKASYAERLSDGGVDSMEDYKLVVGQIRGMSYAEDLIRSAMKGIELDD